MEPYFYKSSYKLKNCHATVSLPDSMPFALALQIVINYNDIISTTDSVEFVEDARLADVYINCGKYYCLTCRGWKLLG